MSAEYLDAISWKKTKSGKPFAVRIGSAKKLDNGNINVYLDALPIPGPDGCQITIAPRREKVADTPSQHPGDGLDDQIPF